MKLILFLLMIGTANAEPIIVDSDAGKFLGSLNNDQFDPDSVSNEFGRYGNEFYPDSINNEFGKYGNEFSPDSIDHTIDDD